MSKPANSQNGLVQSMLPFKVLDNEDKGEYEECIQTEIVGRIEEVELAMERCTLMAG